VAMRGASLKVMADLEMAAEKNREILSFAIDEILALEILQQSIFFILTRALTIFEK
jgi:hypothetical protein